MTLAVALLGTGLMGLPMAANIARAGIALTVWNRTRAKAEPLAAHGARIAATPADAVRGANIVISMLDTAAANEAVLFDSGLAPTLSAGTIVVVMSSLAPAEGREQAARLKALGVGYLDAPVSGGPSGAQNATLAIMAGGATRDFDRVAPVFKTIGRATLVGPAGCGMLAKLANQIIVGGTITLIGEAFMLARAGGADIAAVRDALTGGFADSKVMQIHGKRMLERKFKPGAAAAIQLKDHDNILGEATLHNLRLPASEVVRELYARLVARGLADVDHAGAFLEIEHLNGIDLAFKRDESI